MRASTTSSSSRTLSSSRTARSRHACRRHRPFKLTEFTPGQRSLGMRNENYWDEGKPYVDEWEDISIDDNTARLNALLGGEIDMMSQLPFTQARRRPAEIQVIDAPSPALQVFIMAVDEALRRRPRARRSASSPTGRRSSTVRSRVRDDRQRSPAASYYMDVEAPAQDASRRARCSPKRATRTSRSPCTRRTSSRASSRPPRSRGAGARGGRDGQHQAGGCERVLRHVTPARSSRSPSPSGRTPRSRPGTRRPCSRTPSGTRRTSGTSSTTS